MLLPLGCIGEYVGADAHMHIHYRRKLHGYPNCEHGRQQKKQIDIVGRHHQMDLLCTPGLSIDVVEVDVFYVLMFNVDV